jgi:hypothetical protein
MEITINLPNPVAQEAQANGLLTPESLERLLREELERRRRERLFEIADQLAAQGPPLTQAEVEAEIQAARSQRRDRHASRR